MILTVHGNNFMSPLFTQLPLPENSPEVSAISSEIGMTAEEFAQLAEHYGISQAELITWLDLNIADQSIIDSQVASEPNDLETQQEEDPGSSIFEQITESTLFQLPSQLSKFLNKTATTITSAFDAIEETGKQVTDSNREMLGQFEKTLAVADAVLPITMVSDFFDFAKLVNKIHKLKNSTKESDKQDYTWKCVKASSTMAKIVTKTLQCPDAVGKMVGQFMPDLAPSIKSCKALCGLNIAAQGFSVVAGGLTVAKQWAEAKKAIDYGEATLGTLGLVGNMIDVPATIVKKLALISPAIETAAKVATWAPWLGVVSTVLSATAIANAGIGMGRSLKYSDRLARVKQEAAIKLLSQSQAHSLRKGPVKEQFKEAVKFVEYREAITLLKKMIADLGDARDEESINKAYNALGSSINLLTESGKCGKNIALLMKKQNFLLNADLFVSNASFRTQLKEVLAAELKRVRQLKNDYDFPALMRDIQVEIDTLSAPLLQGLAKVGNEAYIDKMIATDDKMLMYHFNIASDEGEGLKKSLEKISRISKSNVAADITEGVDDLVNCLQNRAKQKISGDIWTLAMSVVSLVATIILTLIAFGLSCTFLAPIAYAVLVAVALASVAKIVCDYLQKNEFKKRFGEIENHIVDLEAQWVEKELEKSRLQKQAEDTMLQDSSVMFQSSGLMSVGG